jgi:hypothetical protein
MAAEGVIHERFAKAFAAVGAIAKGQRNSHHGYAYRGIDDVLNALHGVLADNEIFYIPRCVGEAYEEWETSNKKRLQVARLSYELVFYATDGSSLVVGPVVGQSADTDDKAPMQALSQAVKYALLQAFCIPTADTTDGDGTSPVTAQGGRAERTAEPQPTSTETIERVDALIARAQALNIAGDYDAARAFAAQSEPNGKATIELLEKQIAETDVPF